MNTLPSMRTLRMLKMLRGLALALALSPHPAHAGLTEAQIGAVELDPAPHAQVPLDLPFHDVAGGAITLRAAMAGRPTLLMAVDYACKTLCGPALSIVSTALEGGGLKPGADFRLILFGLDPQASPADARRFVDGQVRDAALRDATTVLTGDAGSIDTLTEAIGYRYAPDPENGAFAHPASFVTLTPKGEVSRALSSLGAEPRDVRFALIEAGKGEIGGAADRLSLLCYGFDAVHGIYTSRIRAILTGAGLVTIAILGGALALLTAHARRKGVGA